MNVASLISILKETLGLFVDDGSLALALILWVAIAGLGLPRMPLPLAWDAPILFVGCVLILVVTVIRSALGREE
jgi:hypothetical protein